MNGAIKIPEMVLHSVAFGFKNDPCYRMTYRVVFIPVKI